jgi:DNA-directed RNA polymerase specialized sigma24 family protein
MARSEELSRDEEIVRLLVTQLRLQVGSQATAIAELTRAGFGPTRIADLLGTTPGTVNVANQRAKLRGAAKAQRKGGDET